jgi:phospholipase C
MDILTKNPEVWKKTIFILTYDENDGYFDHVPSFAAADPKRPETGGASAGLDTGIEYTYAEDELRQNVSPQEARTGPIGMGFRIPTIVASPWSRGGWVNSQLFDHSSTLMFLEDFVAHKTGKQVNEENISAWRRAISGDLTSCFRAHDAKEPKLDYLNRDKFVIGIREAKDKEVPSNYINLTTAQIADINASHHRSQFMSHQEPGVRPSCALPYELYAEGGLSIDRSAFTLRLKAGNEVHGARSAGAPFNVYLRNLKDTGGETMRPATYAVKAGDTLVEHFPLSLFADGQIAVEVHALNGFYREFHASVHSAAPEVNVAYAAKGSRLTGDIELLLRNPADHPTVITVRDNAYKSAPITRTIAAQQQQSILLPLQSSHGWYDFTVLTDGSEVESRYAGRVETGRPSFSDPLMGGLV